MPLQSFVKYGNSKFRMEYSNKIQSLTIETLNNMNRNLSFEFRRSHHHQIGAIQHHRRTRLEGMNDMRSDYGLPFFHHSQKLFERCPLHQSSLRSIQTSICFQNPLKSYNKLQNDVHLSPKHHRKTLPPNLSHPNLIQSHKVLLPVTSPKGTPIRISFSYSNQPKQKIGSTILLASLISSSKTLSQQAHSIKLIPKRQEKQKRCKICSNQFNQYYAPLKFRRKIQKRSAIGTDGIYRSQPNIKTQQILKSLQYSSKGARNEGVNSSKVASTEATQSFHENKRSGLCSAKQLIGSSQRFSNEYPCQKVLNYDSSNSSKIIKVKILNKTTLFGTNYGFGGVIHEANLDNLPKNVLMNETDINQTSLKQVESRHWRSHMKCLLTSQHQNDDMKQSIHCGPDIHHQRFKCQALNGFGRQIKESYIPNNE